MLANQQIVCAVMSSASKQAINPSRTPPNHLALGAEQWLFDLPRDSRERLLQIWRASLAAEGDFGADFYAALFSADPRIARLFPGDMGAQQRRLIETLGEAVRLAGEPEQLVLLLRAAGVRHHHYRVRQRHFAVMEGALAQALKQRLGASLSDSDLALFREWFGQVALVMRHAMAGAGRD